MSQASQYETALEPGIPWSRSESFPSSHGPRLQKSVGEVHGPESMTLEGFERRPNDVREVCTVHISIPSLFIRSLFDD